MMMYMTEVSQNEITELSEVAYHTFVDTFKGSSDWDDLVQYAQSAFSEATLLAELQTDTSMFYVCKDEGRIVGYMKLNVGEAQTEYRGDDALEIQRLYLSDTVQGRGYGSQLFDRAIEEAQQRGKKKVWLGAWEENDKALQFYKYKGMVVVGEHHFIMGDTTDTDLILELDV